MDRRHQRRLLKNLPTPRPSEEASAGSTRPAAGRKINKDAGPEVIESHRGHLRVLAYILIYKHLVYRKLVCHKV